MKNQSKTPKVSKDSSNQPYHVPRWHKPLFRTITVVTIYLVLFFTPYVGPYVQYPFYVVRCLRLPVVATKFGAAYTYIPPGSKYYQVDLFSHYYCTEDEAKAHGYRLLPWDN